MFEQHASNLHVKLKLAQNEVSFPRKAIPKTASQKRTKYLPYSVLASTEQNLANISLVFLDDGRI